MGSLEGLQNALTLCGSTGTTLSNNSNSNTLIGEVAQRMSELSDLAKCGDSEEEFACSAAQDIARLCAEVNTIIFTYEKLNELTATFLLI